MSAPDPAPPSTARRILFLTGTRADFGKLKPLVREVSRSPDFTYDLFVTGMHMLARYGSTVNEIRKAGFDRLHTFINQDGSVTSQMDMVLANTIQGLGHYVREFPPDLMVVHGDRVEALAGAIVGALNNILVGHVEGGELSGTVDELMRHAVSKLSHLHFVANTEARNRLLQMGEAPESVFVVGSPDIDVMLSADLPPLDEVRAKYEIPFRDFCVALYHPVVTELDRMGTLARALVDAMLQSGRNFVLIYPNNDAGTEQIMREYRRCEGHPRFRLIPSMRFEYFLVLLREAQAILGNSSAGVREAPVYGIPAINLGARQRNRYSGPTVRNVPEETDAILDALTTAERSSTPSLHFGDGQSARRFMEALGRSELWATPRQKVFHDLLTPAGAYQPQSFPASR